MIVLVRTGAEQDTLTGIVRMTTRHTDVRTLVNFYDRDDKPSGEIDLNQSHVELLPEAMKK